MHAAVHISSSWLLAGLVLAVLAIVLVVVPIGIVRPSPDLGKADFLKARNDVRTAGIQILGGALLLGGLVFTNRTIEVSQASLDLTRRSLDLTERGQITERFTRAIDQLGSDKLDIRLGGIYSLGRIAADSPQSDDGPVMEVLTAFLRERAPWTAGSAPGSATTSPVPRRADVEAVLAVIRRREPPRPAVQFLDLTSLDLMGADLTSAELGGAHLADTRLVNARLANAYLYGADLSGADLTGADLSHTTLYAADLAGALGLTQAQVDAARTDEETKLPVALRRGGR